MLYLNKIEFVSYAHNIGGRSSIIAEIFVDTLDELPAVDDIEGYSLRQGSLALIVTENKIAILAGDGKWYINGEAVK